MIPRLGHEVINLTDRRGDATCLKVLTGWDCNDWMVDARQRVLGDFAEGCSTRAGGMEHSSERKRDCHELRIAPRVQKYFGRHMSF